MCTGAEILALAGAGASVAGVASQMDAANSAQHRAEKAARKTAEADAMAAQNAGARIAMRKRALASQSLATGGGMSAPGKQQLGGGG